MFYVVKLIQITITNTLCTNYEFNTKSMKRMNMLQHDSTIVKHIIGVTKIIKVIMALSLNT